VKEIRNSIKIIQSFKNKKKAHIYLINFKRNIFYLFSMKALEYPKIFSKYIKVTEFLKRV